MKKVAVLGAGTMGSQIAAHLANASIPCLLFDLPGLALASLERLKKMDPAPLFDPSLLSLIEPLDFGTHFPRLKEADWVLEAVIENLDTKRELLRAIAPHLRPDSIVTSNTSGIPLTTIASEMPPDFKKRWFGTHFFNPPRYLKLLELIPTKETDEKFLNIIADFGDRFLGKGIVYAKDTPNFISNRLATFGALYTLRVMQEEQLSIEEVDALTGSIVGRPKTATFRLFDLVGIDVLGLVAKNLYENVPDDEEREIFRLPGFLEQILERKWHGNKTGQGFYKKSGKEIQALDYQTLEYRHQKKVGFPSVEMVKPIENPVERISNLIRGKDKAGSFLWKTTSAFLAYAANRIPEISDDILNIDNSMKWGFGWSHGPFELWDGIGLAESAKRMKQEGKRFPEWLERLLQQPTPSFYKVEKGQRHYWDIFTDTYKPVPQKEGILFLDSWKREHGVIKKNAGASLVDLGDGVVCLEFHSKMNSIGGDTIQMARAGIELLDKGYEGMVIANQGEHFSAGANLMLLLLEAQEGNWDELNLAIKAFQQMTMSFRYSSKPVVAAPFQLALGGGCEVCLGSDAVHSAAEVYTGLVEIGAGLIPAGGGTKEMLARQMAKVPAGADPLPFLRKAFESIALAKVSRSVLEARKHGYFEESDTFSMNTDRLVQDAKNVVLRLSKSYRRPQPRKDILLMGRAGFAYLQIGVYLMKEAGYISEYDAKLGEKIAWVLTGGDLTEPARVDEQYVLDMEREAFLSLLGERKTQERIQHLLKTGKPLRN
ncbi:3-hydroxyacyl-CoA dehydrogenase/enoyl-CoA hydratase family protein [bacterium]|nr:3-hydroxyacyl-CoA dehydrogenase/enoyl-CoA hydratase family protein [bacterium]